MVPPHGIQRRRAFGLALGTLAAVAVAAPPAARRPRRIGILWHGRAPNASPLPLEQRLRELQPRGAAPLEFESRFGPGPAMAEAAEQLVAAKVELIVAQGSPAALAAQRAAPRLPIVFAIAGDPVALGLASSLARPGGNATGIYTLTSETSGKRVALVRDAVPRPRAIGLLYRPLPGNQDELNGGIDAARALKLEALKLPAASPDDIGQRLAEARAAAIDLLSVHTDPLLFRQLGVIAASALRHRLPAIAAYPNFADLGGLMSYAADGDETLRRLVALTHKVLQGVAPGEVPIERSQRLLLTLNLKTAAALGLTLPPALTLSAHRVIR